MRAVNGRYDELSDRLRKAYNYSQDRIDTEILKFMSTVTPGQVVGAAPHISAPPVVGAAPHAASAPVAKH